ncbi:MAG TPA: hypothetical protein VGE07_26110, partial [Herpetosiphonaceae bacterium]
MAHLSRARHVLRVPHPDPDVRRRGASVIALALLLAAGSAAICVYGLIDPGWRGVALALAPLLACWVGSVWLARRGQVTPAALLLILATIAALVVSPVLSQRVAFTPFFFMIAVLIGIATVRPGQLWLVLAMVLAGMAALALATSHIAQETPTAADVYGLSAGLIVLLGGIGMAGMRTMQRALTGAVAAQQEAERLVEALAT